MEINITREQAALINILIKDLDLDSECKPIRSNASERIAVEISDALVTTALLELHLLLNGKSELDLVSMFMKCRDKTKMINKIIDYFASKSKIRSPRV